ncbi:MAG: phosphate ABC transporter permease PstA, partial [Leptolyngbyaceae bacterium]|nr:phosphate ABC transporter permease PstA [Leptolyngbyaceae bacterium]
ASGAVSSRVMSHLEGQQQLVWSDGTMTPTTRVPDPVAPLPHGVPRYRTSLQSTNFRLNHTRRIWSDHAALVAGLLAASVGFIVFNCLLFGTFQDGLSRLDWEFIVSSSSRVADKAGIRHALLGSIWLLVLPTLFIIPIGIGAAVYNEEYLPPGRLRRFLDLNIANAAAIPSILYGIIGLAIFVRGFESITGGRSILSGSVVMAIIALPILIISVKASLRTVPEDLRQAAYAVGMTRSQMVWTVVLPEAFPGIVTGTLLSLSRIVGETSALLAMGALAFVSYAPSLSLEGLQSSFTTIPIQIYFWAIHPQEGFRANAAASVIVLGSLVLAMNMGAVLLKDIYRRRY